MCSVARGKTWAGRMLTAASSAWKAASYASAISAGDFDSSPAWTSIRSSPRSKRSSRRWPDVGDVLDVQDGQPVVAQRPPDEVGQQVRAQVPDVGVAVHGRAAGVHPDGPSIHRLDRLDGAAQGVAQAEGHVVGILPRGSFETPADGSPRIQRADGPNVPVRIVVIDTEASRCRHRSPGGVVLRGLIPCPPSGAASRRGVLRRVARILRAMHRRTTLLLLALLVALVAGCGQAPERAGRRHGPDPPRRAHDARSRGRRRRRQRGRHRPAVRDPDDLRRRPRPAAGPGRGVAHRGRRSAHRLRGARRPALLGRDAARRRRRRALLVPGHRSGLALAAGDPHGRRPRRARLRGRAGRPRGRSGSVPTRRPTRSSWTCSGRAATS